MNNLLRYYKRSFILEVKRTIIYPLSFWIIALIWPAYSLFQIIFLETIYSQTNNFVGYSKYEAYVLFGTFTFVQTLGHLFFYRRLTELVYLIRGNADESFDIALTKPINTQIFTTTGRFNFGNITAALVGLVVVFYGLSQEPYSLGIVNIVSYIIMVPLGILIYYIMYTIISTFLFWYPELKMTENLWGSIQDFGQYPSSLYQGGIGIVLNILVPLTLMASVPVDFLLGKLPAPMLLLYYALVTILLLITRLFWNFSIKQYSSSSS